MNPEVSLRLKRSWRGKRERIRKTAVQQLKCCPYPAGSPDAAQSLLPHIHLFTLSRLIIPEIPTEQPSCCFPLPSAPQVIFVKPGKMQDS